MKVLVTGATGFIGSYVAEKLLAKGYKVRCIIRPTSDLRWIKEKNYELIKGSLFDINSLEEATKDVDYIYHIAGNTSAKKLNEYIDGNCNGTINLINAAIKNAPNLKRFVYISSQTACGPALSLDAPSTEDSPLNPITDYGKSKKLAEDAIKSFIDKIPFTIIRPPAVYGPRDTEIFSMFKMINMRLCAYIGFNKKMLSLVHIDDLCDGMINAAEVNTTLGKTYFITSEEFYDWKHIYRLMKKELNKNITLNIYLPHFLVLAVAGLSGFLGSFAKKPPVFNYQKGIDFIQQYWICSPKSATKDFGYRQKVSLEQGIKDTINWYKDMKWL